MKDKRTSRVFILRGIPINFTTHDAALTECDTGRYVPVLAKKDTFGPIYQCNLCCQWGVHALTLSLYCLVREKPTERAQTSPLNSITHWFKP